jgi:hypothetical protein
MCGRYTVTTDKSTIEKRFGVRGFSNELHVAWRPLFAL